MPISLFAIRTRKPIDYGVTPGSTTINRRKGELLRRFANVLTGQLSGTDADYTLSYSAAEPSFAVGGLAMSGGSGAVGGIINGVTITASHTGADIASCGLVAATINASSNALVQGFCTANNLSATLTLTSVTAGSTVEICGYRFTATTGVPVLTTSGGNLFNFDISGNDTADAVALCAAINAAPGLSRFVSAISTTNVIRIFARQYLFSSPQTFSWPTAPGTPGNTLLSQSGTIVASGASLIASAFVGLNCCIPGVWGNAMSLALSGTGVTVIGAGARFTLGTGLNAVSITDGQ